MTEHARTSMAVPPALAGARMDRVLAELLDIPVNAARRLCEAGRVKLDGRRARKGDMARKGSAVEVAGVVGGAAWLVPTAPPTPLAVLYEDEGVVVVDKPAGVPSHPLVPGEGGTLVDLLAATHPEIAGASDDAREGGLVHRLDTGTSGCLAVARHRDSWRALRAAFASGAVVKGYLALVEGAWGPLELRTTTAPLAHDSGDPRRMVARAAPRGDDGDDAQQARTSARVVARGPAHALVAVEAEGGRRHQVRVHLAHLGHPLVGDTLYGAPPSSDAPWHLLHAHALLLPGRPRVTAPVPAGLREAARVRGVVVPLDVLR